MKKNITVGFDVEFLGQSRSLPIRSVANTFSDSFVKLLGGTKKKPLRCDANLLRKNSLFKSEDFFIQEDNVLMEFNTPVIKFDAPELSLADQMYDVLNCLITLSDHYGKLTGINTASYTSSYSFGLFSSDKLNNEQAQTFGCDPDYDAWRNEMNISPAAETNIRTAGLHIHIGYPDPSIQKSLEYIKLFDLILFTRFCTISSSQNIRKFMYGKEGAFRFKDYGFEYRRFPTSSIHSIINENRLFNKLIGIIMDDEISINDFSENEIQLIRSINKLEPELTIVKGIYEEIIAKKIKLNG